MRWKETYDQKEKTIAHQTWWFSRHSSVAGDAVFKSQLRYNHNKIIPLVYILLETERHTTAQNNEAQAPTDEGMEMSPVTKERMAPKPTKITVATDYIQLGSSFFFFLTKRKKSLSLLL